MRTLWSATRANPSVVVLRFVLAYVRSLVATMSCSATIVRLPFSWPSTYASPYPFEYGVMSLFMSVYVFEPDCAPNHGKLAVATAGVPRLSATETLPETIVCALLPLQVTDVQRTIEIAVDKVVVVKPPLVPACRNGSAGLSAG